MTLHELLKQYGIEQSHIANKIGMKRGTFNNKIIPNHPSQFTPVEFVEILKVLDETQRAIRNFISEVQ